jgi:tripartite ATP-independent transporter DctM subunit
MVGSLTIGGVALPEMQKLGYDNRLSSGVLAAGGTLSVLIPPSLILLFFGIVTDTSIGDLFIAGIVPGAILVLLFCVVVYVWGRLRPAHIPVVDASARSSPREMLTSVGPIFVIGLVITLSIYTGIATPTEAAAVAALLTVILAFAVGGLNPARFKDALFATMRTMGYLGLLLSAGVLFGFVMTHYRVPQQFTELFMSYELGPWMVLAIVIAFYIVLGMFLEPVSMTFITLPTIFPLMQAAGVDMVWFGIVYTITMEIAVLTPPVGLNLYVIQGISRGTIAIGEVIAGCLPFVLSMVVLIALLIAVPETATWLPGAMK